MHIASSHERRGKWVRARIYDNIEKNMHHALIRFIKWRLLTSVTSALILVDFLYLHDFHNYPPISNYLTDSEMRTTSPKNISFMQ